MRSLVFSLITLVTLTGCVSAPENARAVPNLDIQKYSGKWYEIAKLDMRFEKNLVNTTAEYSLREDGKIKVLNKGFDTIEKKWKVAEGKADFANDEKNGQLKVSFFGPFYAGYNVIAMDPDYENALVAGNNLDYLWILSRNKDIPETVKSKFLKIATDLGYQTNDLIWTPQNYPVNVQKQEMRIFASLIFKP